VQHLGQLKQSEYWHFPIDCYVWTDEARDRDAAGHIQLVECERMFTSATTKNNKLLGRDDDEVMLVTSLIDEDCTPKSMAKKDGEATSMRRLWNCVIDGCAKLKDILTVQRDV
jgi:hypothetical protein